jgi:cytochrome c oxidase cbb3-type subunit II
MKSLPLLFLGIFLTVAFSWTGLILSSQIQFGKLLPTAIEEGERPYPRQLSGIAKKGKQVYIELGCLYCHSQQTRRKGYGADIERGWADRQTVPRDYILQERVLLGTMRTGPDLMTEGQRNPGADWHHLHLYDPAITSPGSIMPRFTYLYELRKIEDVSSPNALQFPPSYADRPPEGYEIIPSERAENLVAYILSLKLDYELPESRFEAQ